jgi:hypothetical protein
MALVARLLRLAALVASLLVIVGFALFTQEQANAASASQLRKLDQTQEPAPLPSTEKERESQHGKAHEWVDDANDVLLAPFASLVAGQEIWVQRVGAGLLALLLYGFVGAVLANYIRK